MNDPLVYIGIIQTLIFALQLIVFRDQANKLRQTVQAAKEQGDDMKRSIGQATRAADAMEEFAEAAAISAKAATEIVANNKDTMTRLLRAYLCVNFGAAGFQNPEKGARFGVQLQLINAGQTPGYKVGYRARAEILPSPLPQDFPFLLSADSTSSESTLGHGQHLIMSAFVDRISSEEEIAEIRSGSKRLYIYGTATYEDVYRVGRYINFCVGVVWNPDGTSTGIFTKRHNDADEEQPTPKTA